MRKAKDFLQHTPPTMAWLSTRCIVAIKINWGNLWFGTNGGGASKYDGKSFITYSTSAQGLASNIIWCITQDHAGNLWFGTEGSGVSKFDGESFTNYTTAQGAG